MHTYYLYEVIMNKTEIFELISKYPSMNLATIDKSGLPKTRGILMYSADENGLIFHTGLFKDLYGELKNNPATEACFLDTENYIQIRISGKAVEIDDDTLRERIINTPGREFLKPVIAKFGKEAIRIFRIENSTASIWSMPSNFTYPKEKIQL